jgi:hypothetical protein
MEADKSKEVQASAKIDGDDAGQTSADAITKAKIKLVEDWRKAHKWLEVQLSAFGAATSLLIPWLIDQAHGATGALPYAWSQVPDELKQYIPDNWKHGIAFAFFFMTIIAGRLVTKEPPK